jgi:hypothetical protein
LLLHYVGVALYVIGNVVVVITLFWQTLMVLAFCMPWRDTEFAALLALLFFASSRSFLAAGVDGKLWLETFPWVCSCHAVTHSGVMCCREFRDRTHW